MNDARILLDTYIDIRPMNKASLVLANALREVLTLHQPKTYRRSGGTYCDHCIGSDEEALEYPCFTVEAIVKILEKG
jgi:hypothetical protein